MFFTQKYKNGYIHTSIKNGNEVIQVQLSDNSLHNCNTIFVAKRFITKHEVNAQKVNNAQKCTECESLFINGVFCHEHGCPNSHLNEYGNMRPIECEWCGTSFVPESKGQKYCSDNCYGLDNDIFTPEKQYCTVCGTWFMPESPDQEYCLECISDWAAK